jgi:PPOX class probable F420-dependent enzyme
MSTGATTAIDGDVRRFLENPFAGIVTTLRRDGSPHSTVVWVDVDDRGVSFNTAVGRAKERHLRADPRVALAVVDPADAYRWVSVTGTAELTTESADAQIDRLAKKYLGKDEYPWRRPDQQRISVRISPTRLEAYGLGD